VTLGFAALAVVLVWPGTTSWHLVLGLVCLAFAVLLRPRLPWAPAGAGLLDPEACPETVALVREIAKAVGSPLPTHLTLSPEFNAYVALTAPRGRLLCVGAPLWVALTGPERVAVLAHELGHFAHRDTASGLFVGTAHRTLHEWEALVTPGFRISPAGEYVRDSDRYAGDSPLDNLTALFLWPLRAGVVGYRRLLELSLGPAGRRREHYADLAAARAAGTAGAVAALEVLLARTIVDLTANRAAITRTDLRRAIRERMAAFDGAQRRAVRTGTEAADRRVDDSHPPTVERLRLVESVAPLEPAVPHSAERWARIDEEWQAAVSAQLEDLAGDYRYVN
jgi:Zn-dependent protease with chaperone function